MFESKEKLLIVVGILLLAGALIGWGAFDVIDYFGGKRQAIPNRGHRIDLP